MGRGGWIGFIAHTPHMELKRQCQRAGDAEREVKRLKLGCSGHKGGDDDHKGSATAAATRAMTTTTA
eukprot:1262121-Pyramimonas_sp.AAC.1